MGQSQLLPLAVVITLIRPWVIEVYCHDTGLGWMRRPRRFFTRHAAQRFARMIEREAWRTRRQVWDARVVAEQPSNS